MGKIMNSPKGGKSCKNSGLSYINSVIAGSLAEYLV